MQHWWLAEYSKGQAGHVPVSHLMIIMNETIQEEGCDRTRKEVDPSTGEEYGWNQYWRGEETGRRRKKEVFSGCDRGESRGTRRRMWETP